MTVSIPTTSERLLVAIDVAKRSHDVLVRWPDDRIRVLKVPSQRVSTSVEKVALLSAKKSHVLWIFKALFWSTPPGPCVALRAVYVVGPG